jgi:5-methylcytosine-specific restriction endonuclease McrA
VLHACMVCGKPSNRSRCPTHRYTRDRTPRARKQRMRVIQRDGFQCQVCSKYVTGKHDTHVDHVIPLADAWKHPSVDLETDENKQTLCADCNMRKGNR